MGRIPAVTMILVLLLASCSQKRVWVSTPPNRTLDSPSFAVALEPIQKDAEYFNWFRLTVTNKTDREMEIDWNRTRYLYNGKEAGVFVFAGVGPEAVKNATIPAAVIRGGDDLSRDIAPFSLIAFTPLRDQSIDTENQNILPGLIPAGENGIFLVIRQKGKVARARVLVDIEHREVD
jgi:hypothetical protein